MNHPTTFPRATLASPCDAESLDAVHDNLMRLNIALLALRQSKLRTAEITAMLTAMLAKVDGLVRDSDALVDQFRRSAEANVLPVSAMDKDKADLAAILAQKAGAQ